MCLSLLPHNVHDVLQFGCNDIIASVLLLVDFVVLLLVSFMFLLSTFSCFLTKAANTRTGTLSAKAAISAWM